MPGKMRHDANSEFLLKVTGLFAGRGGTQSVQCPGSSLLYTAEIINPEYQALNIVYTLFSD